jgi:hypothetical protein
LDDWKKGKAEYMVNNFRPPGLNLVKHFSFIADNMA